MSNWKSWTSTVLVTLVVAGALAPTVGAMGFGANVEHLAAAKAAGWSPNYATFWVGPWTKSYWSSVDSALTSAKNAGAAPLIQWYYWGDSISPSCVQYGCNGRSQSDWNSMGATLASKINAVMGTRPTVVVVETEFNKNGIQDWETFDGLLASHINMMKSKAPNARFVVGFGSWGSDKYGNFDRAVGAAHYTGFQVMRASTRDSDASISAVPDAIKSQTVLLKGKFGKPVILQDLAISSYGGKEWLQASVIQKIMSRKGEYEGAGLIGIVYRGVKDLPGFPLNNYYGYAERYWGLLRADGSPKPAWSVWKAGATGGYVSASTTSTATAATSTATATTTTSTGGVTFSGVQVKNWWQQASVGGSIAKVEVKVGTGSWQAMTKASWGAWTKSLAAPTGTPVEFRATTTAGAVVYSALYKSA